MGKRGISNRKKILIIDGYNIIGAWDDLMHILKDANFDSARDSLNLKLSEYASFTGVECTVVYDAYKVKHTGSYEKFYKNLTVVYTKEQETADSYIERLVSSIGHKKSLDLTVATDDYAVQQIILGKGGSRITSRELKILIEDNGKKLKKTIDKNHNNMPYKLLDMISEDMKKKLDNMRKGKIES